MKEKLTKEQADAILKALDEAIKQGPWDASNFLGVIGKNLKQIREDFAGHLEDPGDQKAKFNAHLANRIALRSGQQEIFISLYSSEGSNFQSWERILVNLPKQMISRPIYADEEDVKTLIRAKENSINEAYVSIYINQDDILTLSSDKTPVDKRGKPLLTIKDGSLKLDNINRFVHLSGIYKFVQGRLVKDTQTTSD